VIQHATCAFIIDSWKSEPYDDRDGVALSRTRVTKTFTGDLSGTSAAELLMASAPHESSAYVGFERIEGSLHGRQGSFVLHHSASADGGKQTASWTIVPDSGTGELAGIQGAARILIAPDGGHTLELAYEIDEHA
jgi:hypothetical protein